MSQKNTSEQAPLFYAGVDGGGTKCRAELYDPSGNLLGAGVAGSANIARNGDVARQSILESVSAALKHANLPPEALQQTLVCGGFAGANLPSASNVLKQWQHPFHSFYFTSDLHSALYGAHDGANGAVLVIGTGSCAAALKDGELIQYGGHGFLLGDKGSGAWLGKQAVIHTLEAIDGIQQKGALATAVCNHYQAHSATELVDKLNQANPGVFGELCPIVLELANQQDPIAQAMVQQGSSYLSAIARKAIAQSDGQLVLAGGVANALQHQLEADIQASLTASTHGPEWGAILLYQHGAFTEGAKL
ncbi:BadF/BadG/BcrA/BcrD ATPase family protein [Pseudidiomarina sp. CB1]|uniref:BadF/BadG/BcrA/BcrD ATPase family protein n=1 Tax=Pseudidiomarina sp. CB1 TaxID=2972484 RepID=UPI002162AFE2|nr:BadF/BadG/BcrA/BcrD ATPase family protein [Pseudidiomarina sp. CB1]